MPRKHSTAIVPVSATTVKHESQIVSPPKVGGEP